MIRFFLFLISFFTCVSCAKQKAPQKPLVLVSIAPYQTFCTKITSDFFDVIAVVPEGANSHIYEPPPQFLPQAKRALVWFQIGDPFEKKWSQVLQEKNPSIQLINLNDQIDLMKYSMGDKHFGLDIHTWLDPLIVMRQSQEMMRVLSSLFPEKKESFFQNWSSFKQELISLDQTIQKELAPFKGTSFLTSHPSFGYFAKRYDLQQIAIEIEGKEPRPKEIEEIMREIEAAKPRVLLLEPQFPSKGPLLIAEKAKINAKMINPYSKNYEKMLMRLTRIIKSGSDPS